MNISDFKELIQNVCLNAVFENVNECKLIPTKLGMTIVREQHFSDSQIITILGLATEVSYMNLIKKILIQKKFAFSDTTDKYQGEALIYMSFMFKNGAV